MQKKKEKKDKQKQSKLQWKSIADWYKSFSYRLIGKFLIKYEDKFQGLADKLKKANMQLTPAVYFSLIIVSGLFVTLTSFIGFFVLFNIIIKAPSWPLYVIGLTCLTGGIAFAFLPLIVSSKISNRRQQIDREIPFILSELSILAATGLTPIKIFRNMAQKKETTAMNLEFKRVIYKIDIDGKDIITAISETAQETPSEKFRETLWDLANMIHQGGDLDVYLRNKADTTMQLKRDIQKEFIEKLGMYSEIYITTVLVGVLFLSIAAFLLDAMATDLAGFNAESILLLLTFLFIPFAIVVFNVLVSMSYSKTV